MRLGEDDPALAAGRRHRARSHGAIVNSRPLWQSGRDATMAYSQYVSKNVRLLSGFGVVSIGLRDQGGDKSAEQGLSAAAGVMHELEEAEVGR